MSKVLTGIWTATLTFFLFSSPVFAQSTNPDIIQYTTDTLQIITLIATASAVFFLVKAGYVYKREGQTMDQVLFSEPSTKMQETLKQRRIAEAKEAVEAAKAKATLDSELASMKKGDDDITNAVDQLLEQKFGEN